MSLTTAQVKYLRSKIGTGEPPTDSELYDNYVRLGSLDAVAREILEIRLADLLAGPETFSVHGEYSQSTGRNIEGIRAVLATLGGESDLGGSTVTIVEVEEPCGR